MPTSHPNPATTTGDPGIWASLRDQLRARRSARTARRDLERELSAFTSPSAIEDLLATLDRYEGEDVDLMREVLAGHLAAYHRRVGRAA